MSFVPAGMVVRHGDTHRDPCTYVFVRTCMDVMCYPALYPSVVNPIIWTWFAETLSLSDAEQHLIGVLLKMSWLIWKLQLSAGNHRNWETGGQQIKWKTFVFSTSPASQSIVSWISDSFPAAPSSAATEGSNYSMTFNFHAMPGLTTGWRIWGKSNAITSPKHPLMSYVV